MRIISKLFRMFSSGGGRTTGRGGMGRTGGTGTATRSRGGIGSIVRRFLR
ncbi:hypothetical protein NHL50_15545 [Acidimicrobiia bacterium EGI L10123]|nr:hypothetical protein [Acidimicrobiia bacterium EGI L10123]